MPRGFPNGIALLDIAPTGAPPSVSPGLTLFARKRLSRRFASINGSTDGEQILGRNMGFSSQRWCKARANTTTLDSTGQPTGTTGTVTGRNPATTNILTQAARISYVAAASAGSSAGLRSTALELWRGSGAGLGGFFVSISFGFTTLTTYRWAVGISTDTAGWANSDPSAKLNIIQIGMDSADSAPQFMYNDGSGTCSKVSTGLANVATGKLYRACFYAAPNGGAINMSFEELNTSNYAEHDISAGANPTNIPSTTTLMAWQTWVNNVASTTQVAIDVAGVYVESDF